MKITFFGGAEEVTGSRYLVEDQGTKILVDCGLFQGDKKSSLRNRDPFPIDPASIDAVVLTHAHVDHTAYVPALIKNGFKGPVYCSPATYALCEIVLVDSGLLQEEYARRANQHIPESSNRPLVKPLYTARDAENALQSFKVVDYDTPLSIGTSLTVTLIQSGHILGASFVIVSDGKETLTFSGDLGRRDQLIMKDPPPLKQTDFLVVESTYGDRLHTEGDPIQILGEVVNQTVAKGGVLIIPAFAVGRTQTILYCLYQLKQRNAIPNIPIFLDSPMAIRVTELYCDFADEHKLPPNTCKDIFAIATYTRTQEESKQIDHIKHPAIIIAGSGMADGGRVFYHLQRFISDAKNTVLFVGFQAEGTDGRSLTEGSPEIKLHDTVYQVRAEIKKMEILSAHADYNDILEWLSHFENKPKKVFLTHGEIEAARSLKMKIEKQFGWTVIIPKRLDSFDLE